MLSVCMATYNGSQFISQQLASIIAQLGSLDEIIVSDDGSTDNTLDIIREFKDDRIKIYEVNFKSPIKNFEFAISKANGEYIFLSDQDDLWLDNRVKNCVNLLERFDLIISNCSIIDEYGKILESSFFKLKNSGPGLTKNLFVNTYIGCCMCFSRRLLPIILPFPSQIPMHDLWIGFAGNLFFRVFFLETTLIQYRRHNNNTSSYIKSKASRLEQFLYRFNTVKYLPLLFYRRIKIC